MSRQLRRARRDARRKANRRERATPIFPAVLASDIFRSDLREPSIVDRVGGLGSSKLDAQNRAYDKMAEARQKVIAAIAKSSDLIHKMTVRQKESWVIASPAIGKMLDPTGEHSTEIGLEALKDLP